MLDIQREADEEISHNGFIEHVHCFVKSWYKEVVNGPPVMNRRYEVLKPYYLQVMSG